MKAPYNPTTKQAVEIRRGRNLATRNAQAGGHGRCWDISSNRTMLPMRNIISLSGLTATTLTQNKSTQRCPQPAQQQGRRMPPFSFESAFSMRIPLVSAFLPEMTQQIHSLRASGVISSHTANAFGVEVIALRKSSGSVCTTPLASFFVVIKSILSNTLSNRLVIMDEVGTTI